MPSVHSAMTFENYNFIVYNLFLLSNISFYYQHIPWLFLKDFNFWIAINEETKLNSLGRVITISCP